MRSFTACFALVLAVWCSFAETPPKQDLAGDALPEGVKARLGSLRFRQENILGFSGPDKLVMATKEGVVRIREVPSGKEVQQFTPKASTSMALSPKGDILAAYSGAGQIVLYGIKDGKEIRSFKAPANEAGARRVTMRSFAMEFSGDGKHLAIQTESGPVRLFDVEKGKEVRAFEEGKRDPQARVVRFSGKLAFSRDGKYLAGWTNMDRITVWEVEGGKEVKQIDVPAGGPIGFMVIGDMIFTPDNKSIAYWDTNGVIRMQGLHDKEKEEREIKTEGMIKFADISRDGKYIATAGYNGSAVNVWSLESCKNVAKLGKSAPVVGNPMNFMIRAMRYTSAAPNVGVAFSPDGKYLAASTERTSLWDVEKKVDLLTDQGHQESIVSAGMSRDGKSAVTVSEDWTLRHWNLADGKETKRLDIPTDCQNAVLSQDGTLLAVDGGDASIRVIDASTGKEKHALKGHKEMVLGMAFAGDGKTLVSRDAQSLVVWDLAKGSSVTEVTLTPAGDEKIAIANQDTKRINGSPHFAISPDAKIAAYTANSQLFLINIHQKRLVQQMAAARPVMEPGILGQMVPMATCVAFSPDGNMFAVQTQNHEVSLIEAETGKKRLAINVTGGMTDVAFSTDGRLLALANSNGTLHLIDPRNGKEAAHCKGPIGHVLTCHFSKTTLLAAGRDCTALTWDISETTPKRTPVEMTKDEFADHWKTLNGDDHLKAYQSLHAIAAAPKASEFIRERLKPVAGPDAVRVKQLIRDLDSNDFDVRSKSEQDLIKMGALIEPAINDALKGDGTLEFKRGLRRILDAIHGSSPQGDRLGELRAIEVLEAMGTPEANEILTALSKGAAGAPLTIVAKGALQRLTER